MACFNIDSYPDPRIAQRYPVPRIAQNTLHFIQWCTYLFSRYHGCSYHEKTSHTDIYTNVCGYLSVLQ